MLRIIFFISVFVALFNLTSGKCCEKKIVGGQTYHLVGSNDNVATSSFGCKNSCSYELENDTDPGKKYCFATGKQEAKCLSSGGSNFSVFNWITDNAFHLRATYSNSSCNRRTNPLDPVPSEGSAQFPNEEYCGPIVTLTADSVKGTPHYSCRITTSYKFPNLYILPERTGSRFPGCQISPLIDYIFEKPNEFFTYVDSWDAIANSRVVWENDDCPPQDMAVIGHWPLKPFTYYDYCGNYTITAVSVFPEPKGNCSVKSNEYPIPNWRITKTDTGCTIVKVDFLEFYIFVDSWHAMATATVTWEDDGNTCATQTKWIRGSLPNSPFMYYDTCGKYTITATSKGATCRFQSNEYPIPNWRIFKNLGTCTIEKV